MHTDSVTTLRGWICAYQGKLRQYSD